MGRIIKYVLLLSHLSLVLGIQQVKDPSQSPQRERRENFTLPARQPHSKDQNDFLKRSLPPAVQGRRRPQPPRGKLTAKTLGLHFYADPREWRGAKRNSSEEFRTPRGTALYPFSQNLIPWKNYKNDRGPPDFHGRATPPKERSSKLFAQNNSFDHQSKVEESEKNRRYHKGGRNGRFHHSRHAAKVCDPCNSVPWVPLLNVPDSYRQQRTHLDDHHHASQHNFNYDFNSFSSDAHGAFSSDTHNAFSTDAHNVLLPPVPLAPPLEPIYDGTISSSFGLPVGNIPTSHGLLAPINHLANKFHGVDLGGSLDYFPSQDLLTSNVYPELSPVPIVPVHNPVQFYQIPDLVPPPPSKPVDVSNVVLTIAEDNPAHLGSSNSHSEKHHGAKDSSSQPSSIKSSLGGHKDSPPPKPNHPSFGSLEIVKSVPLAEFTTSADHPLAASQQLLPLYPPLRSEHSGGFLDHSHKEEPHGQRSVDHSVSDMNFLVPPPVKKAESDTTFDSSRNGVLPFMNPPKEEDHRLKEAASAPRPLTSPSLSWLFSDHTPRPTVAKSTESVSEAFATETREIASIVNSELHPVSPQPFGASSPSSQGVDASKGKKIQIIIPYTTKNKNGHDNNALESARHEVFQTVRPPLSQSTHGSATSVRSTTPLRSPEGNRHVSEIDGSQNHLHTSKRGDAPEDKYLSEMHHIIASNIRELLREEIEKVQIDQNYPLQNNIDNWTALEYSNHKTVEAKAPQEIITQALAVTSIPGTSISHLLIPSKKIPTEYFVTTPVLDYDEPVTPPYNATASSVDSKPFTAKSYATTNLYAPTSVRGVNHETNYTQVGRGRVNHWGRLSENLILPEARQGTTTASAWTSSRLFASSVGHEKVEIVTPIPLTTNRNRTTNPFRRTTRHVRTSEAPTTSTTTSTTTTTTSTTTTTTTAGKPAEVPHKSLSLTNSTRLERVSNATSVPDRKSTFDSTGNSSLNVSAPAGNLTWTLPSGSSEELIRLVNKSEQFSINDIFPFRNKKLPWESALNVSQLAVQNERQRKSLIKQANLPKQKPVAESS